MIINYLLLVFGTFALCYGIYFCNMRTNKNRLCGYVLALGVCSCLWCYGYGFMGLTMKLNVAPLYRKIALAGASGFMCVEGLMFAYEAGIGSKIRKIMAGIFAVLMAGDVIIWGADNVRSFYRVGNRTLYVNGESNGYYYQPVFMIVMTILLFVLYSKWKSITTHKREKRFLKWIFATNIFIFIGAIPDTILPILGKESFPSSPLGGYATMLAMIIVCRRYINNDISKESLSRYAYKYENAGFMALTMAGRLYIANPYAREELGISTIDNQRLSDLFEIGDLYDIDIVNRILQENELDWQFDGKNNGKNYALKFSFAKDEKGDPYCIICSIYDRTSENELIEEIRRLGETKSSFLANMSHEIRTPINAILGMNEMIIRESADSKIQDYARTMQKAGDHLLCIVNDILDYSKIQSGMMDLVKTDYDLSELISEMVVRFRQNAKIKGLDFITKMDSDVPVLLNGDEIRLKQILDNIIENAIKYTDRGSVTFALSRNNISEEEVRLVFTVSDSGKGIKEEDINTLFDAFKRADHQINQTIAGTGLGLAIVGCLVDMMDGEVKVSSEYGKGSEFTVTVTQRIVAYHQMGDFDKVLEEYEAVHANGWTCEFTAPAAKILVVDDNTVNLNVAKYLLKRIESSVDTATSGYEAIEMIKKNAYQLIFLDHIMPGMDGIETLQTIKKDHLAEDVPVIALTANDISGAREMYTDYGFDDYLSKPVSGGSLERKVYEWVPKSFIHELRNDKDDNVQNGYSLKLSLGKYDGNDLMDQIQSGRKNMEMLGGRGELTHIIIINPVVVGPERVVRIRRSLESIKGLRYFVFTSGSAGGETTLVKKIQNYFSTGRLRIYSIGGSGTIRNIINGIEDFGRVEVACCPMGLTNDFMKTFGTDQKLFLDIKNLIMGEAIPVDYIKTTGGLALNTFSMGLDSNLVQALETWRSTKIFGQKVPYIFAFVSAMFSSTPDEYEIFVDDEKFEGTYAQLMFGNGNVLGGSFIFSKKPVVNDGRAGVLLGGNYQGLSMMPIVMAMLKGDMVKLKKLAVVREASKFTIRRRDGGQLAMNFDGEMVYGIEKWEAEIVRCGLKFVVPKGVSLHE